jgi:hypothetical protein
LVRSRAIQAGIRPRASRWPAGDRVEAELCSAQQTAALSPTRPRPTGFCSGASKDRKEESNLALGPALSWPGCSWNGKSREPLPRSTARRHALGQTQGTGVGVLRALVRSARHPGVVATTMSLPLGCERWQVPGGPSLLSGVASPTCTPRLGRSC